MTASTLGEIVAAAVLHYRTTRQFDAGWEVINDERPGWARFKLDEETYCDLDLYVSTLQPSGITVCDWWAAIVHKDAGVANLDGRSRPDVECDIAALVNESLRLLQEHYAAAA